MNILLTGASGLIGSDLLPLLESHGHLVWSTSTTPATRDRHLVADLVEPTAVRSLLEATQPEVIVHLAGGNRPERHGVFLSNLLPTINLFQTVAEIGLETRLLQAGSAAEYGATEGTIARTSALAPLSDYGRAKAAQSTIAEALSDRYGIPLTVIRPFNIYSPRVPALGALGNISKQLMGQTGARRIVHCGRLDVVRDYVSLEVVSEAFLHLAERPSSLPVVNVCSGVGIALADIVQAMAERLGVTLDIDHVPELLALPVSESVIGDPADLQALLGYSVRPSPTEIATSVLDRGASSPPG
jgi:GDP-4-dehydro-6-deoxy-D-mannose reductase